MEEEKKDLEQPKNFFNSQGEGILQEEENRVELNLVEGSKLGKFKNADTLLMAYNNLQSDYTKKCQALSTLQKEVEEKGLTKSPDELKEEWNQKVKDFFESNHRAKKFETELSKIIMEDKDIALSSDPLNNAWDKFVKNNFMSKEEMIEDENFLQNYVFNNEGIREKIIKEYFSSLNFNSSPTLIASQRGNKTVLSSPNKPRTIAEAGKLVEDMFS